MTRRKGQITAFTLVEILVALAVVTLLSSLLLAVFGRVRERGNRAVCQSNLKQIALAMQQYLQDSDGVYPPAPKFEIPLASYVKNTQLFHCPTWSYPATVAHNDYWMNAALNNLESYRVNGRHRGRMLGRFEATVARPTETFLFGDVTEENPARLSRSGCGDQSPYGHHSYGTNYAFVDGHVKWLSTEAAADLGCQLDKP